MKSKHYVVVGLTQDLEWKVLYSNSNLREAVNILHEQQCGVPPEYYRKFRLYLTTTLDGWGS